MFDETFEQEVARRGVRDVDRLGVGRSVIDLLLGDLDVRHTDGIVERVGSAWGVRSESTVSRDQCVPGDRRRDGDFLEAAVVRHKREQKALVSDAACRREAGDAVVFEIGCHFLWSSEWC